MLDDDNNDAFHFDNDYGSSGSDNEGNDNVAGAAAGQLEQWTPETLVRASYKDLGNPAQVEGQCVKYLLSSESCKRSLNYLLHENRTTTRDYSIPIDTFDLMTADPILGHMILRYPATLLPLLENAVVQAQQLILKEILQQREVSQESVNSTEQLTVKGGTKGSAAATRVHARLVHLPPVSSYCRLSLASLRAQDVGKILQVSGTVVRTGPVQMYESARTYQCTGNKGCGKTFVVHADLEQRYNALVPPERCPLSISEGVKCKGTSLKSVEGGSVHTDYQEVKIQEAASNLSVGHIPRSLLIKLQHDLVDICQPGDEVVIVGSLLAQWQQSGNIPDMECSVGLGMSAHSVRIVAEQGSWTATGPSSMGQLDKYAKEFETYWNKTENKHNPIAARDFICQAVCPKLYGMKVIKLALLLALIGGVSADAYNKTDDGSDDNARDEDDDQPMAFEIAGENGESHKDSVNFFGEDGNEAQVKSSKRKKGQDRAVKTRRRDQSHLLLVGDPGTGKSQFLRFAATLCPRSVLTTGVGTTSAGLTCAAVREGKGKEFALEAGALVLADKGVCCIDEFGCIQPKDRTTIHEAMEQQTLSVAKAGIVCKLNCRATIIAVMNPRDCLYDNQVSLSVNTGLGTPLLSRFDLIFKLIDSSDAERDSNVTTYLLNRAIQGVGLDVADNDGNISADEPWNMDKLRAYISIVKERFMPPITDEAAMLLENHYEKCRSASGNTIPITVRFLESLIRLTQAHARLMWRNEATLLDAVATIQVMESSAFCYGGFDGYGNTSGEFMYTDPMTMDFSNEADLDFACFEYRFLSNYNMLQYMPHDKRRQASIALGSASQQTTSWKDMETMRNNGGYQNEPRMISNTGEYQDQIYGGPNPFVGSSKFNPFGVDSVMTQDHYGRVQMSESPTRSVKKARR